MDQSDPNPFRVFCPKCNADSDAEDKEFIFGSPVLAPHAYFALVAIQCNTCRQDFDVGLWPVDPALFMENESAEGQLRIDETPDGMLLVDRYLKMVQVSRRMWEIKYRRKAMGDLGHLGIYYPRAYVDPSETRITAIPVRCLAAARGLRQTVGAHPGLDPVDRLRIGAFQCVLSLEQAPTSPAPYCLHLSISGSSLPRTPTAQDRMVVSPLFFPPTKQDLRMPTDQETGLLSCLFFTPTERRFLTCEAGQSLSVTHVRLDLLTPELSEC